MGRHGNISGLPTGILCRILLRIQTEKYNHHQSQSYYKLKTRNSVFEPKFQIKKLDEDHGVEILGDLWQVTDDMLRDINARTLHVRRFRKNLANVSRPHTEPLRPRCNDSHTAVLEAARLGRWAAAFRERLGVERACHLVCTERMPCSSQPPSHGPKLPGACETACCQSRAQLSRPGCKTRRSWSCPGSIWSRLTSRVCTASDSSISLRDVRPVHRRHKAVCATTSAPMSRRLR